MRGLPGHPIRSGTPVREPRRLPDHLPDRLPDRLPHDEEGSAEISYVWTVFLSSMILTSVMISLTQAVDSTDVAHGQAEVDEVAARVVYGINTVLELSRKYPEVAHEQRVDFPKSGVSFVVLGLEDRIVVRQTRNNGASVEMVIYNDQGSVISGKVRSSTPYLIIDYQPGSNTIQLRAPFEGV